MSNKINKTGYTKNSKTEGNNYNIVPSGEITMENTKQNLMAVQYDDKGQMIGIKFMKPGEEHKFKDTEFVMETPQYKNGGNKDWITSKVNSLMKEGKSQKEAVNMVYGMFNNEFQFGGQNMTPAWMNPTPVGGLPMSTDAPRQNGQQQAEYLASVEQYGAPMQMAQPNTNENPYTVAPAANVTPSNQYQPLANLDESLAKVENMDGRTVQRPQEEQYNDQKDFSQMSKIQFYNPYGGVDLKTSSSMLGAGIQSGDATTIGAAGLKTVLGLGRNITSGMGQQKVYQNNMNDYYKNQRDLGPATSFQAGGELDQYSQMLALKEGVNDATGIPFTTAGANQVFGNTPDAQAKPTPQIDFGQYKELGYFDVGETNNGNVMLHATPNNTHMSKESVGPVMDYLRGINPGVNLDVDFSRRFQQGGQMKGGGNTAMYGQGEYRAGIDMEKLTPEQRQYLNSETEKGEYIKDPNTQQVSEIVGNTHEQGGEKMIMEEGERVLTDHTKLGAKLAKDFSEKYDLKLKAKNTYSDVLDRYRTKSGLKKLLGQEEDTKKDLEKVGEQEDGETKDINNNFLNEKLAEIQSKKEPLEKARQQLFDNLFEVQQGSEPKEEQNDVEKMQAGNEFNSPGRGLDNVPQGQRIDPKTGLYGNVDPNIYGISRERNPWFDWGGFDPSNPEKVMQYQQEFNNRSGEGVKLKVDGKFGQQTQSAVLNQGVGDSLDAAQEQAQKLTAPKMGATNWQAPQGAAPEADVMDQDTREALNMAMLPNQYPFPPGSLEAVGKYSRSYDRVDPSMIDPTIYLQELKRQESQAMAQTEGLPPQVRAAANANITANTQKAASDLMLKIDTQNQGSENNAELVNARISSRQEDARVTDSLNYEQRALRSKALTDNDIQNYLNRAQEVSARNYNEINNLNMNNQNADTAQFNGPGYTQAAPPEFEEYLNMLMAEQASKDKEMSKKKAKK